MIITKQQAQMLTDLASKVQDQYGIIIGYSNPAFTTPEHDADFIIFEDPRFEDLHCFHKDDIKTQAMGPLMVRVLPREPEHDDKVEALLERLNEDLLEGKIWFDPGIVREIDGLEISVTKKNFPGTDEDIFDTNIFTEKYGTVYTYEFIVEAAHMDKRFKIAKDIIDETWPRPVKAPPKKPNKFAEQLVRFLRFFGL